MATGNQAVVRRSLVRRCWRLAFLWGVVCALAAPGWGASATPEADGAMGLFEVYARNKQEGAPNYVTEDVLLLSYGMIRVAVGKALERERRVGAVRRLIEGLRARIIRAQFDILEAQNEFTVLKIQAESLGVPSEELDWALAEVDRVMEANLANLDYLAVLTALAQGSGQIADAGESAQAELDLVLAARDLAPSPLWGRTIDYTQFKPRGHYSGDPELERYFRAVRYAGAVLFAVTASKATGVSESLAERMTRQAVYLAGLIEAAPDLTAPHQDLMRNRFGIETDFDLAALHRDLMHDLAWRIGPPEDIPNEALLALDAEPEETFRRRLLAQAKEEGWQPRIIAGVVDLDRLEDGVTAADAMTGWRLLPQRYTPESAAFQQLVFGSTGEFQGALGDTTPFGLTLINGRPVKGFPLLAELMALWGSRASADRLREQGETAFEGYDAARERAQQALGAAEGLNALHQQLIRTGLQSASPDRLTALRAFWTWQRYAALLYAKQSYTPVGKGLEIVPPRPGARLEPSLDLYKALKQVVEAHRRETPHASWKAFAGILDDVIDIASRQQDGLDAADEQFLNGLDTALKALTGGPDAPIVVDVHTNPASREVLQEATGKARLVAYTTAGGQTARGARFTQCEFKHPMADRLDDAGWRNLLASSPHACGRTSASLADKLDANLVGLLEVYAASGMEGVQAYAVEHALDLRDGQVEVTITAVSADAVNALKGRVADAGGIIETDFENAVYATLPVGALKRFVMQASVWRVDGSRQVAAPPGNADVSAPLPGSDD